MDVTIWPLGVFTALAVVVVVWASWVEKKQKAKTSENRDRSGA
ncbi:hypothetical protein [Maricaulis parjimensis]|nr:hypothetical protein [Maricaulis parjimensis]